jgi:hypothetical protein
MRSRNSGTILSALALAVLGNPLIAGCAHHLGPDIEPTRVARGLGLAECSVSEPMRRYQALDFADLLGIPNLADSPEWATAISVMQPGDDLRHVYCKSNGDNFFGLFRGSSVLLKFGTTLDD